jgi:hypothetical protein
MFTFIGVVTYYRSLLERRALGPQNQKAAARRTAAQTLRLSLAVCEFAHARLTDFGEGLFEGTRRLVEEAERFASQLSGPDTDDAIAAVLEQAERAKS